MNSISSVRSTEQANRGFRDLPFIAAGKWAPGAAGSYVKDCQLGRAHAQLMLDLIRETRSPTIYPAVARCMTMSGQFGGVEVGFTQRVAEELL